MWCVVTINSCSVLVLYTIVVCYNYAAELRYTSMPKCIRYIPPFSKKKSSRLRTFTPTTYTHCLQVHVRVCICATVSFTFTMNITYSVLLIQSLVPIQLRRGAVHVCTWTKNLPSVGVRVWERKTLVPTQLH